MTLRKKESQMRKANRADYILSLPVLFLFLAIILWFAAQRHVGNVVIDMPYTVLTVSMALSILISLVVYLISQTQAQSDRLNDQLTANERLTAVLNATSDIMITFTLDGTVLSVNTSGKRKLGIAQTIPQNLSHIYTSEHEAYIRGTALPVATKNGVWQGETRLKTSTADIPVSQVIISHTNERGEITSFSTIARDMTEELRLKEGEQQLEQNKNDFLSIAAHQMRTPLGSMKWRLEMLLHGDFGAIKKDVKDTVEQLIKTNQRMINLINNLLDVSFIEENRVKNKPASIHLPEVIKKVVQELTPEAHERGITFSFTFKAHDIPPLFIDPEQLYAVIENIISNAVKYNIPGGNVTVHITQDDAYLILDIIDTGIGIPKNDQKHLFRKFFRAPNAAHTDTDGSGLGLYVAASYVAAWGGSVSFADNSGKGTTFTIRIPKNTA